MMMVAALVLTLTQGKAATGLSTLVFTSLLGHKQRSNLCCQHICCVAALFMSSLSIQSQSSAQLRLAWLGQDSAGDESDPCSFSCKGALWSLAHTVMGGMARRLQTQQEQGQSTAMPALQGYVTRQALHVDHACSLLLSGGSVFN